MAHLLYRCYAKINLSLEILGKRQDGFHDLASLVHTVNLADDLRIAEANDLLTRVEGLDIDPETNLVWRAARLLAESTGERRGAELSLVKRIPPASGLGGGSSDAATTLVGLNRIWGQRLGLGDLEQLAASLGSDVPFFVRGGAALMQGRGDELRPVRALESQWLILLVPSHDIADKTKRLYGALQPTDYGDGEVSRQAAEHLARGERLEERDLSNGFDRAAREVFPALADIWSEVEHRTGKRFHLSGAGPSIFALADDRADAKGAILKITDFGQAFSVRTVKHARASIAIAP